MRHFRPTSREIQLVQASTVLKPKHLLSRFVRAEIHLSIPRRYHEVRAMIKIYKVAAGSLVICDETIDSHEPSLRYSVILN